MDGTTHPSLEVKQERFVLHAHLASPVFDLFKDFPSFSQHLFSGLGVPYNLRLADLRLETGNGSLGDIFLRISWPNLAEVRIFLDRVEIEPTYLPFLRFQEGDLVDDVLTLLTRYAPEIKFRTYSVTQEVHGNLIGQPRHEFLAPFAPSAPEGLGPSLGAGIVYYFGAAADQLFASFTLDFSRVVEGGIFLQSVVLYDALKVSSRELQAASSARLDSIFRTIGIAR